MPDATDPLAPAHDTAHQWLSVVADRIGTEDRQFTHRVLRTWLHLVRDRLSVDSAAHFAAQLPEVLRGVFYDGWVPSRVPVRYDAGRFTELFAHDAGIRPSDVPTIAAQVTEALDALCSPGQLDHVLARMPAGLRGELEGRAPTPVPEPRRAPEQTRLAALEDTVETLAEAVAVLVRGLEELPTQEPGEERTAKAAQEAHRLLLARDAAQPTT